MTKTKAATLAELRTMKARGGIKPPKDDAPQTDMPDGFWDGAQKMVYRVKTRDVVPIISQADRRECMIAAACDILRAGDAVTWARVTAITGHSISTSKRVMRIKPLRAEASRRIGG